MTRQSKLLKSIFWLLLSTASALTIGLAGVYLYLSPTLPSVESLRDIKLQAPLRIYSSDLKLIGQIGEKRRIPVNYEEIPQHYIDALLAAEDDQFYSHHGISIKGLMRATSQLLISGDKVSGGSTITMQVARNYFLTLTRTFERKFREILLAIRIEQELTKKEILELYVNFIFMGNRAYGIQAASQTYYGKPLGELNLPQLAMLAGIPKGPSSMNPLANPERAKQRRDWILHRMQVLGKIDAEKRDAALSEPLTASYHGSNVETNAPYISELARKEAVNLFGNDAYTAGYAVITTVNSELQASAQKAVADGLMAYDGRHGYRGAEKSLITNIEQLENPDLENWAKELKAIKVFRDLVPAAVTSIEDKNFSAILSDGSTVEIVWENGLKGTRKFRSPNARSAPIRTVDDLLQIGDVVRLKYIDDAWHFSQVPDAQAAIVSLDAYDGAVLALIGGFDFQQSKFNRVVQATRQPGSNFKPFMYTKALEMGMTPATTINDAPIVFEDDQLESAWRPENSSGKFYGPTRLRKALYLSRNLVSIRVLRQMGIKNAIDGMSRFGFDADEFPRDLSISLGSYAMPPIDIATGYASFANGGYKVSPYWIKEIKDYDGNTVYQAVPEVACKENCLEEQQTAHDNTPYTFSGDAFYLTPQTKKDLGIEDEFPSIPAKRIIDPQTAYLMDSMLKDVVRVGTGRKAQVLKRKDAAGKTGTTNGVNDSTIDAWFSGYSSGVVTTAWVGYDDNRNLGNREFGGVAALPIWIDFMKVALEGRKERSLPQPPNIVTMRIDPNTGKKALPNDRSAIFEVFNSKFLPEEAEDNGEIDTQFSSNDEEDISTDIF